MIKTLGGLKTADEIRFYQVDETYSLRSHRCSWCWPVLCFTISQKSLLYEPVRYSSCVGCGLTTCHFVIGSAQEKHNHMVDKQMEWLSCYLSVLVDSVLILDISLPGMTVIMSWKWMSCWISASSIEPVTAARLYLEQRFQFKSGPAKLSYKVAVFLFF